VAVEKPKPFADPMSWALAQGVRLYQRLSPGRWQGRCIYMPSCSEYAIQALRKHGFPMGVVLTLRRLARCGGNGPGGEDYP